GVQATGGAIVSGGKSHPTVSGSSAVLKNGLAYAPSRAPAAVKAVIWAANQIRHKPYKWGGGHGSWKDTGYDCSGSVSYALHGGSDTDRPRGDPHGRAYPDTHGAIARVQRNAASEGPMMVRRRPAVRVEHDRSDPARARAAHLRQHPAAVAAHAQQHGRRAPA